MTRAFAPLAGAVVAAFSLFVPNVYAADAAVPRKAPELAFTVPGQGPKLLSQYRGKVVALEFIFTTCPHCQAASKLMTKLQQEYGPRGFQVIDVAVNDNADLLVENFERNSRSVSRLAWTPKARWSRSWVSPRRLRCVPQLVLIDRKGDIHYQTPAQENEDWDKLMKEDNIRQHVEELSGRAASTSSTTAFRTCNKVALNKKAPDCFLQMRP